LMAFLPKAGKSFGPPKLPTLLLTVLRLPFALLPVIPALVLQVIGTLLVFYSFWVEPHKIRLTRQVLRSAKLKAGTPPIKILHLGDLHMERITQRERQLNRLIKQLKPDVILFSGDFLSISYLHDETAINHARQIISGWQAPYGVYAVTGSTAVDFEEPVKKILDGLHVRWLDDEAAHIELNGHRVNIAGVTCTHKPHIDTPRMEALAQSLPPGLNILLYHSPDLAPNAARTGAFDLQVSGHTHGGQVRLPVFGALFAGSLYGKRFESGRYQLDGMTLYVSRGLGLEGKGAPRVRFLCPPEAILWEITGTGSRGE
jgi:uncharacterized protein